MNNFLHYSPIVGKNNLRIDEHKASIHQYNYLKTAEKLSNDKGYNLKNNSFSIAYWAKGFSIT